MLGEFGSPSAIASTDAALQTYDVWVGGGPAPAWWEQEHGFREARRYVYSASFSKFGPGYLAITTAVAGKERVVAVSFSLPSAEPESKRRAQLAFTKLLDLASVPEDHPLRTTPLLPAAEPALGSP